jgi:copper transport protein
LSLPHIASKWAIAALSLLVVAGASMLVPGSVLAHAYLDHADPAPGSTVAQAPTQLRLTFSEQVDNAFSQVHVLNARRETVDLGDSAVASDDPHAMVVSVQPGLTDGVYTVAWRTLSADDGHSESGAYTLIFGVAPGGAGVVQPQSSVAEFSAETALARWWLYLAAGLLFGPLLAWQIVFRPLLQGDDGAARVVALARTRRLVSLGAVALVAGTLYAALAQAASASGLPLWSVVGLPLHDVLTSGHYASIWWPRLSLALLCLVLLVWRGVDGLAGDLVLATTPAVLLTSSLASHAAAVPGWSPLAIAADWLHFMATSAWLGGLASVVFVLPAVVRAGDTPGAGLFAKPVARFSNLALVCVVAVALTGAFQAWLELGSWGALVQTAYGLSVSAKIALTVLMLGFGSFNILVARPRLSALVAQRIAVLGGVLRAFGRSVRAELVVGVLVLAVAAILTGLPPGRGELARQTGVLPAPVDRRLDAQGLAPRVRISPSAVGQNHLAVELSGAEPTTIERVQLTLTYLDGDLGSEPLILQPTAGTSGTWEADSSALSQPGQWQADLLVRRQGQDDVRSTMRFPVVAASNVSTQTDSSAAYPPVPAWLPLALGGTAAFLVLCAVVVRPLSRRTSRRQVPLEPESFRAVLRGRDPFDLSDDLEQAHEAVGAGQAGQAPRSPTPKQAPEGRTRGSE